MRPNLNRDICFNFALQGSTNILRRVESAWSRTARRKSTYNARSSVEKRKIERNDFFCELSSDIISFLHTLHLISLHIVTAHRLYLCTHMHVLTNLCTIARHRPITNNECQLYMQPILPTIVISWIADFWGFSLKPEICSCTKQDTYIHTTSTTTNNNNINNIST